jgi:putative ABC transport system permease protein
MFRRRRTESGRPASRTDEDFAAEVEAHIVLEAEHLREEGLTEQDALAAARRAFGNTTLVRETFYESRRARWWDDFRRDFRYGFRALRKSPGFAVVAVLTLALGIGANTAIFSIVSAVLIAPLPFPNADRLVMVRGVDHGRDLMGPSPIDALDYGRLSHSFERLVPYDYWRKNVSGIGDSANGRETGSSEAREMGGSTAAQEMLIGLVPSEYFEALRIRPVLGRLFRKEENVYGKHYVAVVNTTFWRERYAGRRDVLGRTIRINGEPYTIVGVVPDAIPRWMDAQYGLNAAQIWTPAAPYADFFSEANRGDRGVFVLARMKPGVAFARAQADLDIVAAQLARKYPIDRGIGVKLEPLGNVRVGSLQPILLLLSGAVGLILLIACSNVANLLLVRHSGRRRELAIRAALGGRRGAIVRQLTAESLVLGLLGGGAGVLLALAGTRILLALRPPQLRQLSEAHLDLRVLLFSAALSILTILVAGLAPAFTASRVDLADALKDAARGATSGGGSQRVRRWLVVAETGLALMLMVGAGLLLRTVGRLQSQDLGYSPDHLMFAHVFVPEARYPDAPAITRFAARFRDDVMAIPGVREATITNMVPGTYNRWKQFITVPGREVRSDDLPRIGFTVTDEHFLSTCGIPLVRGRDFAASDRQGGPPVALITQAAVKRFFPGEDPIGRTVHLGKPGDLPPPGSARLSADVTIVGVVGDMRNEGLKQAASPQLLALYRQLPTVNVGFKDLIVRTALKPTSVAPVIAERLRRLDPDIPLSEVAAVREIVLRQTSNTRFTTTLLGLFAALGTILALVGVYGVISYAVAQRTHEIGVRMALGARAGEIVWLILRPGIALGLGGAGVGILGAAAARRVLGSLLFGISPLDPPTFAAAAGLLLFAVAAACAVPAIRASRVDPVVALRYE